MQALLDDLAHRHPGVGETLAFHETGDPPPSLDGVRAVVFLLADPLRERFPACFADASAIATAARTRGLHLVNPPEALSNTVKSTQSRIWQEHGIPTPAQLRFETHDDVATSAEGLSYPLILRPDDEHAQHGLRVCGTRQELQAAAATLAFPSVVAPLVDCRTGFVALSPGTPFARYHHKKRALVLGDCVLPNELFFSRSPIVASETCTFRKYAGRRTLPAAVARIAPWDRSCVRADVEFAHNGRVPEAILRRAVHVLGLEIAAVDYADLADGNAILWEANPHFLMPPVEAMYLPGQRRMRHRYAAVADAFAAFFSGL